MTIKSEYQLEQEWGFERFTAALGILSGWWRGKQHPISKGQLLELHGQSADALDLFVSKTVAQAASMRAANA